MGMCCLEIQNGHNTYRWPSASARCDCIFIGRPHEGQLAGFMISPEGSTKLLTPFKRQCSASGAAVPLWVWFFHSYGSNYAYSHRVTHLFLRRTLHRDNRSFNEMPRLALFFRGILVGDFSFRVVWCVLRISPDSAPRLNTCQSIYKLLNSINSFDF